MSNNPESLTILPAEQLAQVEQNFAAACREAKELQLANNAVAAFRAAALIVNLQGILTDQVMNAVFMPLMNSSLGFLTDHDPNKTDKKTGKPQQPYSLPVVRNALIDAIGKGLLPTGNQFNIIADRMYPTKEGFTALLFGIKCKYLITYGAPKVYEQTADVECTINYEWKDEKKSFKYVANVKKDGYSSLDQIKGKAERKAKKVLYEYLTGIDFGDADENSSEPVDEQPQPENKSQVIEEQKQQMRGNTESSAPKLW